MTTATPAHLDGVLADRSRWTAGGRCSIDRAMRLVGTRSAMLLMREAFYGTTRFDDFAARVGVTEAVASARLKELVEAGLLRRAPYREAGQRTRHEYLLTEMGADLLPAAVALMQWGDKYLADPSGPPLRLTHGDSADHGDSAGHDDGEQRDGDQRDGDRADRTGPTDRGACGAEVTAVLQCAVGHSVALADLTVGVRRARTD